VVISNTFNYAVGSLGIFCMSFRKIRSVMCGVRRSYKEAVKCESEPPYFVAVQN